MTFETHSHAGSSSWPAPPQESEEVICWSRMQAEAGQGLGAILDRKECERRAGHGLFFWGVGNAPALLANVLARVHRPVPVVFSIMKSRPKIVDVAPARTVVWRSFIDAQGVERDLPPSALVTSRGDSASGAKKSHYALMCHSAEVLALRRGQGFDPTAYRNAGGTGAPIGSSQVTALLRRVRPDHDGQQYEVNLTASLTGSYWVRLTQPRELSEAELRRIDGLRDCEPREWLQAVASLRGDRPDTAASQGSLL